MFTFRGTLKIMSQIFPQLFDPSLSHVTNFLLHTKICVIKQFSILQNIVIIYGGPLTWKFCHWVVFPLLLWESLLFLDHPLVHKFLTPVKNGNDKVFTKYHIQNLNIWYVPKHFSSNHWMVHFSYYYFYKRVNI